MVLQKSSPLVKFSHCSSLELELSVTPPDPTALLKLRRKFSMFIFKGPLIKSVILTFVCESLEIWNNFKFHQVVIDISESLETFLILVKNLFAMIFNNI